MALANWEDSAAMAEMSAVFLSRIENERLGICNDRDLYPVWSPQGVSCLKAHHASGLKPTEISILMRRPKREIIEKMMNLRLIEAQSLWNIR